MGLMLVKALSQRDYPVIQGGLLLFSASFIVVNLIVDVIAVLLDPRRRRELVEGAQLEN
jgi:peptide/nickel transport system permease protein